VDIPPGQANFWIICLRLGFFWQLEGNCCTSRADPSPDRLSFQTDAGRLLPCTVTVVWRRRLGRYCSTNTRKPGSLQMPYHSCKTGQELNESAPICLFFFCRIYLGCCRNNRASLRSDSLRAARVCCCLQFTLYLLSCCGQNLICFSSAFSRVCISLLQFLTGA